MDRALRRLAGEPAGRPAAGGQRRRWCSQWRSPGRAGWHAHLPGRRPVQEPGRACARAARALERGSPAPGAASHAATWVCCPHALLHPAHKAPCCHRACSAEGSQHALQALLRQAWVGWSRCAEAAAGLCPAQCSGRLLRRAGSVRPGASGAGAPAAVAGGGERSSRHPAGELLAECVEASCLQRHTPMMGRGASCCSRLRVGSSKCP